MKFKFLRQSRIMFKGQPLSIEVWQELYSGKLFIMDRVTKKQISLGGAMGEEI